MKIVLILIFYIINIVPGLSELKSTIFFINAKEKALSATSKKAALRYGFHKTQDCKSFDKAFLCIQKCVDLNYDVAHADKHCQCTCYVKQERAKYKPASLATKTRWRSGPPKTSIPYWAGGKLENKTEEGSESSREHDDTGTESPEGMAGGTDSIDLDGETDGTGVTGATDADATAATGDTGATDADGGSDATVGEATVADGETAAAEGEAAAAEEEAAAAEGEAATTAAAEAK